MIDLYYWPTPNGWKITIFFEETGIPYRIVPVNIGKGEQFTPEFLKISPNNACRRSSIPTVPTASRSRIFESGAILVYLGEKTGQFLSARAARPVRGAAVAHVPDGRHRPMFGQAGHFRRYAPEKIPYAIDRYTNESKRLLRVLDGRLADRPFVAGDYSIADMAIFPWVHAVDEALGGFDATPTSRGGSRRCAPGRPSSAVSR
jgi:GST-like protein